MFSTNHILLMLTCLKVLGHIIFFNNITTLTNDIVIGL